MCVIGPEKREDHPLTWDLDVFCALGVRQQRPPYLLIDGIAEPPPRDPFKT